MPKISLCVDVLLYGCAYEPFWFFCRSCSQTKPPIELLNVCVGKAVLQLGLGAGANIFLDGTQVAECERVTLQ
jgi:hypothetical protein